MNRIRRIASVFWLALALLVGQQAAALHDLGHATERFSQKKDSHHPASKCDKCFACAELSGAVGVSPPVMPVVVADNNAPCVVLDLGSPRAARLAFRSHAPPSLS